MKKEIIDFVKKNSWFQLGVEEASMLLFITCENGNIGDEEPGMKDIQEARRLKKLLHEYFPAITVEIDTCDEWTELTISLLKR